MMNNRIVLFGKNGFLSSNLINFFKKKQKKLLIFSSNKHNLLKKNTIQKIKHKIRDDDIIIFTSFIKTNSVKNNIQILENVIIAIKTIKIKKFIYISSDSIYYKSRFLINENSPCKPLTDYGKAHLLREKLLFKFFNANKNKLLVLRLCNIYGYGHHNYGPAKFISSAIKENKIYLFGKGEELRSHVYVLDFAKILLSLIELNKSGVFNIASKQTLSFLEIAEIIKDCIGYNIEIISKKRKYNKNMSKSLLSKLLIFLRIKDDHKIPYAIKFNTKKIDDVINIDHKNNLKKNLIEIINIYKSNLDKRFY